MLNLALAKRYNLRFVGSGPCGNPSQNPSGSLSQQQDQPPQQQDIFQSPLLQPQNPAYQNGTKPYTGNSKVDTPYTPVGSFWGFG